MKLTPEAQKFVSENGMTQIRLPMSTNMGCKRNGAGCLFTCSGIGYPPSRDDFMQYITEGTFRR